MSDNLREKNKNISYVKIGAFFMLGFFILFFSLVSMKEFNFFQGTHPFVVSFEFAEGLRSSSPVRFCGVDAGEVKKVVISQKKQHPVVYVHAVVDKKIAIPKNSLFIINSLSLFGEKYLEIIPPEEAEGYLKPNDLVAGVSPIPLFSIFSNFTETMQEVKFFFQEGDMRSSLEKSLANIENITMNLNNIIEDTKGKNGTIGRLFYDDSLYRATEEFILDIRDNPWKLLYKPRDIRR
jgi:ABC-type transporter Mla subunit MlaD